jgi:APA family basic amino acid/polyamine antiporter
VASWNAKKTFVPAAGMAPHHRLTASLGWPHLIALGVGAIVGTGILTLTGVGAGKAGPAVILSFAIAGLICAAAALAYAEMATMIPASGSAYTYTYVVLGELAAWLVGWSLILEYSLVVSAVAVGWSGYAAPLLSQYAGFPPWLARGPALGGVVNLPAILIIAVVAGLLIYGTRESATANAVLVVVKVVALIVFVAVTLPYFDAANFEPFMPYGFAKNGPPGAEVGVMAAAAIIFFAFYGFDAIATAAEETRDPGRDLSIGIVGSMLACVVIYMTVAGAAIGALTYTRFADSPEPLALILREIGQPLAAQYLALSAVIALPTVILAFFYGQSRIFFVMARDGMLPESLARVSGRGSPVRITLFTAVIGRRARRVHPAGRARRARQCRDARRLHRGRGVHAGDAPARARRRAQVSHALRLAGRRGRHPRLPLSHLQPAAADTALVPRRARRGAADLRTLRRPAERRGAHGRLTAGSVSRECRGARDRLTARGLSRRAPRPPRRRSRARPSAPATRCRTGSRAPAHRAAPVPG